MKVAVIPWRDPTFFAFVLLGIGLLCSGALCQTKARTGGPAKLPAAASAPTRSYARPVATGALLPSSYAGSPAVGPFTF